MEMIDPIRRFQINGQVYTILCTAFSGSIANNQAVVAAVSGKRTRVFGWKTQARDVAVVSIQLKSASGGTALTPILNIPPYNAGLMDDLPFIDSGYFETNTGEGLYVDIAGTTGAVLLIFYITYTP